MVSSNLRLYYILLFLVLIITLTRYHNGNPPISSFTCDISKLTTTASSGTKTCQITDIYADDVPGSF